MAKNNNNNKKKDINEEIIKYLADYDKFLNSADSILYKQFHRLVFVLFLLYFVWCTNLEPNDTGYRIGLIPQKIFHHQMVSSKTEIH